LPSFTKETKITTAEAKKPVEYLSYCIVLEEQMFSLYNIVAKKMRSPELNNIIIALAYDSLKHLKTIEEQLKPVVKVPVDLNECEGTLVKAWTEIRNCLSGLSEIEFIRNEILPDFLKSLTNIEDTMSEIYSNFIKSKLVDNFAFAVSNLIPATKENVTFIMNFMIEDNLKHRAMLIEAVYFFNKNKCKDEINTAPVVRYRNPDAWITQ
jgi:rubrerythrin